MLHPCKSDWNLPTIPWDMVHTSTFGLKFGSLSPAMTLKIRSRWPKANQLFIMSQCYIHANLLKFHPLVHEISCKPESVMPTLTPTPTGSAPRTICPPPLREDIMSVQWRIRSDCLHILMSMDVQADQFCCAPAQLIIDHIWPCKN